MVRVSSLAKLRPWSGLTAKMAMGVVPGFVHLLRKRPVLLRADIFGSHSRRGGNSQPCKPLISGPVLFSCGFLPVAGEGAQIS